MLEDNPVIEELRLAMLQAEEEIIDTLYDRSLEDLIIFYHEVAEDVLDDAKHIENIIHRNSKAGHEAIFSTFRVLKSILAEIEYRIKENKI